MSPRSFLLDDVLHRYVLDHSPAPDPVLAWLVERTRELGDVSGMQIGPDQSALLTALTRFGGVQRAVEVGTFTGASALAIARGLAPGGRLLCCDVSEEWTAIAREGWQRAGVADRIELRIGPGIDTLRALPTDDPIDLAFVDADKPGYVSYFDELVPRLRPGGLLIADNTLWSGRVIDDTDQEEGTRAIRAYNDHARDDPRVETVLVATADGLTISQKR